MEFEAYVAIGASVVVLALLVATIVILARKVTHRGWMLDNYRQTLSMRDNDLVVVRSTRDRLEQQLDAEKNAYTKYECTFCGGKGEIQAAGRMHGHPEEMQASFPCDVCEGDGYLYKRKIEEPAPQEENEVLVESYSRGVEEAVSAVELGVESRAALEEAMQRRLDAADTQEEQAYCLGYLTELEGQSEMEDDGEQAGSL